MLKRVNQYFENSANDVTLFRGIDILLKESNVYIDTCVADHKFHPAAHPQVADFTCPDVTSFSKSAYTL